MKVISLMLLASLVGCASEYKPYSTQYKPQDPCIECGKFVPVYDKEYTEALVKHAAELSRTRASRIQGLRDKGFVVCETFDELRACK